MSTPATNVCVQSVLYTPMRIVKGQFRTAAAQTNSIDLSDFNIQTNPNSVVLVSFTTAALGIPASLGAVGIVSNDGLSDEFLVSFSTAPAANVGVDFIIFG